MKSRLSVALIVIMVLGLVLPDDAAAEFTGLPAGFQDELVVNDIPRPTSIAWLPESAPDNGDLLITSQEGELYRYDFDGSQSAGVILDLSGTICSDGEMGLLGLAVDPAFDDGQRYIYLYYTDKQGGGGCKASNRANRVSRFPMDTNGELGPEEILIDNIPARGGNHNGGDLQFGNHGLLYITVGDSGRSLISKKTQNDNTNARFLSLLNGKILRIEPDGDVPPDNPFTGSGTISCAENGRAPLDKTSVSAEKKKRKAKKRKRRKKRKLKRKRRQLRRAPACQEIFATGLRNPYRIAFDPDSERFYINDVGGGSWEEISEGAAGADYGWNVREGPCKTGTTNKCGNAARFTEPIFAYRHSTGCRTITGGAFVPNDSSWATDYGDAYLFADFICQRLFALQDDVVGQMPEVIGDGSRATHLAFGPDDELYYTTFTGGGQVRSITAS